MGKNVDLLRSISQQAASPEKSVGSHSSSSPQTLEDFAYHTLSAQFHYILTQEDGVMADADPEYLHQMRVGFRKFQAAIEIFGDVIDLPAQFKLKDCKQILKTLGRLRDLDVQLQGLTLKIKNASTPGKKRDLIYLQRDLKQDRRKAFTGVSLTLGQHSAYPNFKRQIKGWLKHPHYSAIAKLPVNYCVPDLLCPWVSKLLLHSAWLISQTAMTPNQFRILHDLRKLCKQLRYQSEFFQDFYPQAFTTWIEEVKGIQSVLGKLQDACVFEQLMAQHQGQSPSRNLEAIAQSPTNPPLGWENFRQRYCNSSFRRDLHELILSPLNQ
jgi:CHAD domain-containing protein